MSPAKQGSLESVSKKFFDTLSNIYSPSVSSVARGMSLSTAYSAAQLPTGAWMVTGQSANAQPSISVELSRIVMSVSERQSSNAQIPMRSTPSGIVTPVSELQPQNAASPMLAAAFGMVMFVASCSGRKHLRRYLPRCPAS